MSRMSSTRWFLLGLAWVLVLPLVSGAKGPSEYANLLSALKAGNTSIDYGRLRLSYVDSPERKQAKDTSAEEKAMSQDLQAKDFAAALKNAEVVLDSDYVNIDAHFVAFVAERELGDAAKAEFHRTVFRGLIDSIRNSGDGKSPEKAWVVISVDEEYVVLRTMGLRPSGQSLVMKNGHAYDVMKAKNEDGKEETFYFNTDIPMKDEKF
jgi:hypothetical protein